jgi:UDP-glucose 4-epimerase
VCEWLVAKGTPVRALARAGGAAVAPGAETAIVSDLLDRDAVRGAMEGARAVVHLAARVHVMEESSANPLEAFRRVNVEGTRIVVEEALRAGVAALVFISSVKAVGEATDVPWTDDVVPAPVDPYGISKLEAERLIRDAALGTSLSVHVLRLPLVYGPGMKGNMRKLFDLVDRGLPLPFGRIENRRALIYCGNVAGAIGTALDRMAAGASEPDTPFFISDGHDVSTPALVREIARALGRPARLIPIPPQLIRALGRTGDAIARLGWAPFTSNHAMRLLGSLALDVSRFASVTGFQHPFTMAEGLAATARWYRSRTETQLPAQPASTSLPVHSETPGR